MTTRPMKFRGDNLAAFHSEEPEILSASAAGTGKSMSYLAKIAYLASIYPGSRHLIVRKTRSSLTETALVTLETAILEPNCPMLFPSNQRKVRQSYRHANGSEIIVGGMDKPDKVLSSEYDTCFCQEGTELELDEWETLIGRLRNNRMPYQQIMADCNPTYPHHWLYKRWQSGKIRMFRPTHKDNPRYWITGPDGYGMWSKEGADYLSKLDRLTGFRRKRFLEGVWAAAEGLVFEAYDATIHNLPPSWEPPKTWRRYHSVDFGHTNPMVYQYWAEDEDERLYLYKERYETKRLVEDLAKQVKQEIETHEPRPQFVVGDHDAEDRATFEKHSGIKIRPADKRVNAGIDLMNARLVVQADGKPRVFFKERAVVRVDRSLAEAGKPTSFLEEVVGYVWDSEKDKPVKENDHACDAGRYLISEIDGRKKTLTLGVR